MQSQYQYEPKVVGFDGYNAEWGLPIAEKNLLNSFKLAGKIFCGGLGMLVVTNLLNQSSMAAVVTTAGSVFIAANAVYKYVNVDKPAQNEVVNDYLAVLIPRTRCGGVVSYKEAQPFQDKVGNLHNAVALRNIFIG